jgi:hypothetical protein
LFNAWCLGWNSFKKTSKLFQSFVVILAFLIVDKEKKIMTSKYEFWVIKKTQFSTVTTWKVVGSSSSSQVHSQALNAGWSLRPSFPLSLSFYTTLPPFPFFGFSDGSTRDHPLLLDFHQTAAFKFWWICHFIQVSPYFYCAPQKPWPGERLPSSTTAWIHLLFSGNTWSISRYTDL